MNPWLITAAIGLELASCLSFVVLFRLFFAELPAAPARRLAWSQMGSGALLPGGGVGALAIGGWLLHLSGMSTRRILTRSSGLFFLTSGVNVLTLVAAALALWLGLASGPHDALRSGLPILAGVAATTAALAVPRLTRRISRRHPTMRWIDAIGTGVTAAREMLLVPHPRLLGSLGYLLFDIAVLWVAFAAVGPPAPVAPLTVAYLVGYLANSLPVPGGVGVLDAGLVGALALYGLPLTHAAAAVLVYHAIAFWIPALGGVLEYARLHPQLTQASAERGSPAPAGVALNRAARTAGQPACRG